MVYVNYVQDLVMKQQLGKSPKLIQSVNTHYTRGIVFLQHHVISGTLALQESGKLWMLFQLR